ncbi:MAG TPA: nickel-responsive transcriptional regulator NikR [bacterium]
MNHLVRFGVSMESALLGRFDRFIERHGYSNRSEAVRDLVRDRLVQEEWQSGDAKTVGTITLIYDHAMRELSGKLTDQQHRQHESVISAMHVHLDHHNCLEVLAVHGRAKDIQRLADDLLSLKGVKHGKLVMTTTGMGL